MFIGQLIHEKILKKIPVYGPDGSWKKILSKSKGLWKEIIKKIHVYRLVGAQKKIC